MKLFKKILSVVLTLMLVFGCVSTATVAVNGSETETSSLPFLSISDIHIYPESLMGNRSEEWMKFGRYESKCFNESEAILIHALDNAAKRAEGTGLKYILLPGDLTKDSEYAAHVRLAEILADYSERYGFKFLVTVGNHDINNHDACSFENDTKEPARAITAAEFPVVYADCGYGDAIDRFAYPERGENVQGALSYVYDLDDNYRLIAVDSSIYDFGTTPVEQVTGGKVTPELMSWIKSWTERSYAEGKTPFLMLHHGMAAHMEVEPSITHAFPLDDYLQVAEQWASWGLHYCFTGHLHTNDIACVINDDGDALYDIETNSLTGFPNMYRENRISTFADGHSELYTDAVDFDSELPFSFDGVTYGKGEYKFKSFNLCFGGGIAADGKANITDFLVGIIRAFLGDWIVNIGKAGGIVPFLKTMDIDLEKIITDFLSPYIGSGLSSLFSKESIMSFIGDLDEQICEKYIDDPEYLYSVLEGIISKLAALEVADVPCTRFIDTVGFGDESKNGTLNELVLTAMYYWYTGNEDADRNDPFFINAIEKLESGETCEKLFNSALDLIVNDLLQDEILSNVDVRLEELLGSSKISAKGKEQIRKIGKVLLKNDLSYKHLIDTFFALEILPYDNLLDTLDGMLISEYLTDSQFEGTGNFIAYVLKDFSTDVNPKYAGDFDVTYSSEKVDVPATRENYRLPTDVAITMGEDSTSEAYISFYSKYTLDGDIEIYKGSSLDFTGRDNSSTADFGVDVETSASTLSYPGIDIGVIGFFNYEFPVNRTVVKLTGLESGETYSFRVGNEKYGWWSETGTITTADGGNETTFIHTADPQSQTENQYSRSWARVLKAAYEAYPDADFSLNTGDLVDHGDNSKQWAMMFNTASDTLMNTFFMPATGNHEGKGTNATANYFVLPNQPEQDTTTGVYYSYDYNNVHVSVLNTEDLGKDNALSKAQLDWLKADANGSDADWKFVVLHKAIYSNGSHFDDKDVSALRDQLSVLMPQLGIDMVFQGHDHVYLRTGVMDSNKVVDTPTQYLSKDGAYYKSFVQPHGTVYAISGTAGVKTYLVKDASQTDKVFPRAEKLLAVDYPMFSAVEIKDKVLYFSAYTVTEDDKANAIDRIAIQKDASQGDVAEDYEEAEEAAETESCISTVKSIFSWFFRILNILLNLFKVVFIGV